MDEFIKFPTGQKAKEVMEAFEEKKGFPGVIGAVDGTHIPIKAPKHNHEQYINRKGFFSIQLQVICDPDLFITDVFVVILDRCMMLVYSVIHQYAVKLK